MSKVTRVKVGMTFRKSYADANPEWRVVSKYDAKTWLVEVTQDCPDYAGAQDVMATPHVLAAVNAALAWQERFAEADDWFDSLTLGQTVHYHNGFGDYVRCVVVIGTPENVTSFHGEENIGRKVLQPVALLGQWRHDLPSVDRYGEVHYGHHAAKIIKGIGAWRPSDTCVYEAPACRKEGRPDPRTMEPLDLTPKPLTPEQQRQVPLWCAVRDIEGALEMRSDNPASILTNIDNIMQRFIARP